MDNKVFNVNGSGNESLIKVLEICFNQEGHNTTVKAWSIDKEKGMILYWIKGEKGTTPLPVPMNAIAVSTMVSNWLESEEAEKIILKDWDMNADHDGSNSEGWRVYVEDWGHVAGSPYAICAITPAFMWHGK